MCHLPESSRTMPDECEGLSRRRCLAALSTAGAGSLAGCGFPLSGGSPSRTPRESDCSGGDTAAADIYDDAFLQLRPDEYTGSTLTFVSAATAKLTGEPRLWRSVRPFLDYPERIADRTTLGTGEIERLTTVRPPGTKHAAYVACRVPAEDLNRRTWLSSFKMSFRFGATISITEQSRYRGYRRWETSIASIALIAVDDDRFLFFPERNGPIEVGAQTRLERLVETDRDESDPYHCYHPDARALVERLRADDLVFAWFRTDDDTFGGGNRRVPTGARASAFALDLRRPGRDGDRGTDAGDEANGSTAANPAETDSGTAASPTRTDSTPGATATAEVTESGSSEPLVDLELVVAFPDGSGDPDAVRDYVRENRSGTDDSLSGPRFDDPSYESIGRVVRVTETRRVEAMVE